MFFYLDMLKANSDITNGFKQGLEGGLERALKLLATALMSPKDFWTAYGANVAVYSGLSLTNYKN